MRLEKMRTKFFRLSGFTLAELIVVIAVLAILATIGFLALSWYTQNAKESSSRANARSLQTAISSESALTNYSPRYYVIHDSAAALSGVFIYVDGSPVALTGGDWNVAGTNYSAGNPDFVKLKLNPEKFKTSFSHGNPFDEAFSAYDTKKLAVGAVDFARKSSGKNRTDSWFQVVAIPPAGGSVSISGTFPVGISGSVAGLVRDPAGTVVDPLVEGAQSGTPTGCSASVVSGYSVPAIPHAGTATVTKSVASGTGLTIGTRSATATCAIGTSSVTENSIACIAGYVEGPALTCIADVCGGTISDANAHSTATLQTVTQNWARSATAGTCTWDCNSGYGWDSASSMCKASVNGACWSASKTYAYADSTFGSDVYCGQGTASSTPSFPAAGSSATWTCLWQWNGTNSTTCTATHPAAANCAASTQTVNGRSYSVSAFNHAATTSANSSSAVLGGSQAYSQGFSCTNGVVATSGSETAGALTCSANFTLNGAQCLAKSCLILKNAGITTSGNYNIDPDLNASTAALSVYCDMATDGGGYTFYPVSSGLTTSKYTDNDSCKSVGLHIFVPRTQAHLNKALADYNGYVIGSTVGVYGLAAGSYTAYPMNSWNSNVAANWKAVWSLGNNWFMRSVAYSEPNGDYTPGCWLNVHNSDANGLLFNDYNCMHSFTKYLCSSSDK